MWVHRSGEFYQERPVVIYEYQKDRDHQKPLEFYRDYKGILETDNTLLVLKDSYANSFIPFLAQHYRKIIMIDPRYYFGDLEQLMQVENVQEILYLYNANTFFTDTSLELALTTAEQDSSDTSDIR